MNRAFKVRLTAFALVIVTLAIAIGFAAYSSWREVGRLQQRMSTGHLRSFEIADHIQESVLQMQTRLVSYELRHDAKDRDQFWNDSAALDHWIIQQKPTLTSARELELLNQVDSAYDLFLRTATNALSDVNQNEEAKVRHIEETQKAVAPLFQLGYQLADAHRATLEDAFVEAQKSISILRWAIFGSLALLIGALIWLFATVYREMIAPLQLKLVQSHAIIERQEKLASLGVLAAGVAHEIRNPLTAIKARLFSQQKSLPPGSPVFDDVLVIGKEIDRLDRIVKEVLQFARPPEPRLVLLPADVPLREAAELMRPQLERNGIRVKLDGLAPAMVQADPQQLKQVLINLVQNAADSIDRTGTITLRARVGH